MWYDVSGSDGEGFPAAACVFDIRVLEDKLGAADDERAGERANSKKTRVFVSSTYPNNPEQS